MVTKFKNHLARTNLAKNTVNSYVWTVAYSGGYPFSISGDIRSVPS